MPPGGFIPPFDRKPTPSSSVLSANRTNQGSSQRPLRRLTQAQQIRLTQHLDDQLIGIERNVSKRTTPATTLPTLSTLLTALKPLLTLILLIPPIDPTTYIRVQYLLSLTSSLREWITAYPLLDEHTNTSIHRTPARGNKESRRTEALSALAKLLSFLSDLDLGWQAVLAGKAWENDGPREREGSVRLGGDEEGGEGGGGEGGVERQVLIGKEMSVTDKIRLRSSILSLREKVLSWSEIQTSLTTDTDTEGDEDSSMVEVDEAMDVDAMSEGNTGGRRLRDEERWKVGIVGIMNGTLEMLAL